MADTTITTTTTTPPTSTVLLQALLRDMEATLACIPPRGFDSEPTRQAVRYLRLRTAQTRLALQASLG